MHYYGKVNTTSNNCQIAIGHIQIKDKYFTQGTPWKGYLIYILIYITGSPPSSLNRAPRVVHFVPKCCYTGSLSKLTTKITISSYVHPCSVYSILFAFSLLLIYSSLSREEVFYIVHIGVRSWCSKLRAAIYLVLCLGLVVCIGKASENNCKK